MVVSVTVTVCIIMSNCCACGTTTVTMCICIYTHGWLLATGCIGHWLHCTALATLQDIFGRIFALLNRKILGHFEEVRPLTNTGRQRVMDEVAHLTQVTT